LLFSDCGYYEQVACEEIAEASQAEGDGWTVEEELHDFIDRAVVGTKVSRGRRYLKVKGGGCPEYHIGLRVGLRIIRGENWHGFLSSLIVQSMRTKTVLTEIQGDTTQSVEPVTSAAGVVVVHLTQIVAKTSAGHVVFMGNEGKPRYATTFVTSGFGREWALITDLPGGFGIKGDCDLHDASSLTRL